MFDESPFAGACAASTWEVLAMILGSALLGLLLGYLIWGWLRGRILRLEQRNRELERIAQLKDSQIVDLNTRITALDGERERLSQEVRLKSSQYTQALAEVTTLNERIASMRAAPVSEPQEGDHDAAVSLGTTPESLAAAATVFSKRVKADDLTIIEGIGPKISGLLADAGISSWAALGQAKVDMLRNIVEEAGPRYRMHDPATWARQARMAARGEWKKLKIYQDSLNRGK